MTLTYPELLVQHGHGHVDVPRLVEHDLGDVDVPRLNGSTWSWSC